MTKYSLIQAIINIMQNQQKDFSPEKRSKWETTLKTKRKAELEGLFKELTGM